MVKGFNDDSMDDLQAQIDALSDGSGVADPMEQSQINSDEDVYAIILDEEEIYHAVTNFTDLKCIDEELEAIIPSMLKDPKISDDLKEELEMKISFLTAAKEKTIKAFENEQVSMEEYKEKLIVALHYHGELLAEAQKPSSRTTQKTISRIQRRIVITEEEIKALSETITESVNNVSTIKQDANISKVQVVEKGNNLEPLYCSNFSDVPPRGEYIEDETKALTEEKEYHHSKYFTTKKCTENELNVVIPDIMDDKKADKALKKEINTKKRELESNQPQLVQLLTSKMLTQEKYFTMLHQNYTSNNDQFKKAKKDYTTQICQDRIKKRMELIYSEMNDINPKKAEEIFQITNVEEFKKNSDSYGSSIIRDNVVELHMIKSKLNEYIEFSAWLNQNFEKDGERESQIEFIENQIKAMEATQKEIKQMNKNESVYYTKNKKVDMKEFFKAFPDIGKTHVYGNGMDERGKQEEIKKIIEEIEGRIELFTRYKNNEQVQEAIKFSNHLIKFLNEKFAITEWQPIPKLIEHPFDDKQIKVLNKDINNHLTDNELQIKIKGQERIVDSQKVTGNFYIKWSLVYNNVSYGNQSNTAKFVNGDFCGLYYNESVLLNKEPFDKEFIGCSISITVYGEKFKEGITQQISFADFESRHTLKKECRFENNDIRLFCNVELMKKQQRNKNLFLKYYKIAKIYPVFNVHDVRKKTIDESGNLNIVANKKIFNNLGSYMLKKSQFSPPEPAVNEPKNEILHDEEKFEEQPTIEDYKKAKTILDFISSNDYEKLILLIDQKKDVIEKHLVNLNLDNIKNYECSVKTVSFADMLVADCEVKEKIFICNSDMKSAKRCSGLRKDALTFSEKFKAGFEKGKLTIDDYFTFCKGELIKNNEMFKAFSEQKPVSIPQMKFTAERHKILQAEVDDQKKHCEG